MVPLRLVDPGRGCAVPGCEDPHYARELCKNHARKVGLYGVKPEEIVALFGSPVCASCGRPWARAGTPSPLSTTTTKRVRCGA